MCGIAGILNTDANASVDAATVRRMCNAIRHRGPDDEGVYTNGPVGLGMRRLSIIDLSGGHQPISNEDGTIRIVFNGEIYNFPELKAQLERKGHQFSTRSDTEVIVHLYEEHGASCVQKLRGMFAFAIYDERRRSLLLARDRLGKKPLHYAFERGTLHFGSEIKSILTVAPELAQVERDALVQFFYFGYIPDPLTAFSPIKKLPPGHVLELTHGKIDIRRYWDLPAFSTHPAVSEEEYLAELERRLTEAVKIRLISEVPLGALLSGGTDSSIVVALMARASSRPVKTFSIAFRSGDFDESSYARLVADRFGTDHHEMVVEPNISDDLERLTHLQEEPFADSSMLPTYHVCRMARQEVTVALSGDAGDELFAGYKRYQVNLGRRWFDYIPASLGRAYREQIFPHLPSGTRGRKFAYNVSLLPLDRYLDTISYLPPRDRERSVFSEEFAAWTAARPDPLESYRRYFNAAVAPDYLSRLLYLDAKTYLTADILAKVDRMSMANSLEVRVPLLDHEVVEWVTSLPVNLKLHNGTQKYLLKKLAERVGVPADVLYRPKQGFALPLVHWMRNEMKSDLPRILLEPRTIQRGYFNPKEVERIINEHQTGRFDQSAVLWQMLVLELWHRNYLAGVGSGEDAEGSVITVAGTGGTRVAG
jgi:asparagine synthase (glutamine-hydrolysing)